MAGQVCYHDSCHVVDTRLSTLPFIRRRRRYECNDCGVRFNTVEILASDLLKIKDYELHLHINQRVKEAREYAREASLSGTVTTRRMAEIRGAL